LKTNCFLILTLWIGCTIAAAVDQEARSSALTSNSVYQKNCAHCHGKTARGRHLAGPSLISERVSSASIDDLRTIINIGKGRMPKFSAKLTPVEVDQLLMQIKAANQE